MAKRNELSFFQLKILYTLIHIISAAHEWFLSLNDSHELFLNDFIKNDALRQQEMNLNITQLAICDGEIIGFINGSWVLDEAELLNIAVEEKARRKYEAERGRKYFAETRLKEKLTHNQE